MTGATAIYALIFGKYSRDIGTTPAEKIKEKITYYISWDLVSGKADLSVGGQTRKPPFNVPRDSIPSYTILREFLFVPNVIPWLVGVVVGRPVANGRVVSSVKDNMLWEVVVLKNCCRTET